ncbi:hypothetical protein HYH03_008675 [Edaphochlamys debaryana]|uniref:diacylglycerol O-acyltransferase n=1 Tax=Edaphochlamys debaryana TaxID=47281 RepID=A0A835Y0J1_9CHLO|nr:hypothetical protein HYH03_008675 [Edaphochlamys debaryana]|eukprot:KAG2493012.1 hypothetical protein HYH03_008675 [Edaphochlamys debaryana]
MANEQLQEKLAARAVHMGEYLHKWKQVPLPLLGSEWELRYWVLSGSSLAYYRSAKDSGFSPREEISVLNCYVAWEGLRSGRYWTFSVLDGGASLLVRLAALSREGGERWLAALEAAGCVRDDSLIPREGPKGSREAARAAKAPTASLSRSLSDPVFKGPETGAAAAAATAAAAAAAAGSGSSSRRPSRLAGGSAATPNGAAAKGAAGGGSGGRSTPRVPSSAAVSSAADGGAAGGAPASRPSGDGAAAPAPSGPESASATAPAAAPPRRSFAGQRPSGGPVRGPMLGSSPVHTAARVSPLSSERAWHEKHTGMYNLGFIIIVLTNFRLALENALKYGWRLNPVAVVGDLMTGRAGSSVLGGGGIVNVPLVLCYPCLLLAGLMGLGAERAGLALLRAEGKLQDEIVKRGDRQLDDPAVQRVLRARARLHEWLLFLLNAATTSTIIVLPWTVIYLTKAEPVSAGILFMLAIIMWMKMVSYHHCCFDLREARRCGEIRPGERGCPDTPAADWGPLAKYPENLTLKNLLYFLALPTLVYQVNYPLSRSVRGRWLLRRLFEMAIGLTALAIIIGQYIEPAVTNSLAPLRQMDLPRVIERVLKLALPSTYAWLLGFFCLFHAWLNILAELTRFGDREFYKDWWNAATVGDYWKLWNMPVHKWLLRHVYFPAIRAGVGRFHAIVATFFVSAVFHELILGVPLHLVRLWAFCGIMLQVPLIMLTEKLRQRLRRDELGNYVFWITFCVVGQPVCVLLYYHDYVVGIRPKLLALRTVAAGATAAAAAVGAAAAQAAGAAGAMAAAVLAATNGTLAAGAGGLVG